jgi:starvation-inducible DNA-binding protein
MEKLYKLISDAQATLFVLFHKTWVYHWDVEGPDFQQLHVLFGEQYEAMFEEIDRISEHMRYLNIKPVSTLSRSVEVSKVNEASNSTQEINANKMVGQLLGDNETIIKLLIEVSEEAERQKSYATANLAQDLMETHGKFVWMLRSISKP